MKEETKLICFPHCISGAKISAELAVETMNIWWILTEWNDRTDKIHINVGGTEDFINALESEDYISLLIPKFILL